MLLNMPIKSPKYTSSKYSYMLFTISAEKSVISNLIFNEFCFPIPCAGHWWLTWLRFHCIFWNGITDFTSKFPTVLEKIYIIGITLKSNSTLWELISAIAWKKLPINSPNSTPKKFFPAEISASNVSNLSDGHFKVI